MGQNKGVAIALFIHPMWQAQHIFYCSFKLEGYPDATRTGYPHIIYFTDSPLSLPP